MQIINKLGHFTPYQQTILLLAIIRPVAATLVSVLFVISNYYQWGFVSHPINWLWLGICYSLLLLLSVTSFIKRYQPFGLFSVFALLLADALLWFLLLKETGGAMNPANSYFLILLLIATLVLPILMTSIIFFLILVLYTGMMLADTYTLHSTMGWHLWGMWLLFFFTAIIIMVSIHWLSTRIRRQDKAINAFKEATFRSEQLVMMGTMAASAAHEMATPLSTIAMLAEDSTHEDADLISQQVKRCKESLQQLKAIPEQKKADVQSSFDSLDGLKQDLLLLKPKACIDIVDNINGEIQVAMTLRQALLALMVNAIDAAQNKVTFSLFAESHKVIWQIEHDGQPIAEPVLKALGVKWVSSKKNGLGIGYFLANASIENLQGKVKVINQGQGVLTRVELPIETIIIGGKRG